MSKKQKKMLCRIITSALLMIILHFIPAYRTVKFFMYLVPYLIIGYDVLIKAAKGIINGQVLDENFLMSVKCKVLIMSGCLCKNGKLLINLT